MAGVMFAFVSLCQGWSSLPASGFLCAFLAMAMALIWGPLCFQP